MNVNRTLYMEGNMTTWKNSSVFLCSSLVYGERRIKYLIIPALGRIKQERLYAVLCVTLEILCRLKENERRQHLDTSQFRDEQCFKARLDGTMSDLIQWKVSLPRVEGGTRWSLSSQFYVKLKKKTKKTAKPNTQKSYQAHTAHWYFHHNPCNSKKV